jgi:C-terminal processing protease CtpA/Prc
VVANIDVPDDATVLDLSLALSGRVDVVFDELLLTAAPAPGDDASPLSTEERGRLRTFIQMIGYLRFFYPGDGAARADWHSIETEGVDRMLQLTDLAATRRELASLLARIAPDAAVYSNGSPPDVARQVPAAALTRWIHVGLGGGDPSYASFRTVLNEPPGVGMRLSLRRPLKEIGSCKRAIAHVILEKTEGSPVVQLEAGALMGGVRMPKVTTVVVTGRQAAVQADIAPDAYGITFGVFISGIGSVEMSGIKLSCDDRPVAELRSGPEIQVSGTANHLYLLTKDHPCGAGTCLRVARRTDAELGDARLDVSIGPDTRLRMPLAVAIDGTHTIPATAPPAAALQLPASARSSRLAAVLDLWIMLRWFYPCFADEHIDWDAALDPALDEAARAVTNDAQRHALSRLTSALRDDHARVIRPGIDDGLLPLLFRSIEGRIVVAATLSPLASVPVGSTLISIDGVPATEARKRAAELISAATPAFEERHSTYSLAFGRRGTLSNLVIQKPGQAQETTAVVPHLERSPLVSRLREPHPATGTEISRGIVYVDLHTLDETTWTALLPKLAGSRAIIFDLRGYVGPAAFIPLGHLTDREIRSPAFLVPIISPAGAPQYEQIVDYTPPRQPRVHAKAIFLADARTASAPETILQFVRGEHLGLIMGESTGGTNGNIIEYSIIGNMSMRFTGMRVVNHDGTVLQGRGIVPDIVVHPTLQGIVAGRDEILEAAIRFAEQNYQSSPSH